GVAGPGRPGARAARRAGAARSPRDRTLPRALGTRAGCHRPGPPAPPARTGRAGRHVARGRSWRRRRAVATHLRRPGALDRSDGGLLERFGWLELRLRLTAAEGTLRYEPAGAALRLGRWRLPLPAALAPTVRAVEAPGADGATRVNVEVALPGVGLLIAYDGW